jgi:hypothetical protein
VTSKKPRTLLVFRTDDSTDGIPVAADFMPPTADDLLDEFYVIDAADGSTVIERTALIRRLHLKDS